MYKYIFHYAIIIINIILKEGVILNKYEMTLREIRHGKSLEFMADPMKLTVDQGQAKVIYDSRKLEDYTGEDLATMLRQEIAAEELMELALDKLIEDKQKGFYNIYLIRAISVQNISYWRRHADQKQIFLDLLNHFEVNVSRARLFLGEISQEDFQELKKLGDGF